MTQLLVATASSAAIYALVAVALNIVYRSGGIINFGAGYMAVFVGTFYVSQVGPGPIGLAMAVALGGVVGILGYGASVYFGAKRGVDPVALSISLLGFGMLLDFAAGQLWGHRGYSSPPMIEGTLEVGGTSFATERVVVVAVASVFIVAVLIFY